MQLENGAKFLKNNLSFLSSASLDAALCPAPLLLILPLTSMYASL